MGAVENKYVRVPHNSLCVFVLLWLSNIFSEYCNKRGSQVAQSLGILTDLFLFVSIVKTPLPKVT